MSASEQRHGGIDLVAIFLAALAIAVRWIVLRQTHSTTEDFLITLRYAENLAEGRGFVYNAGEHVLGTTTPLYTLILALASIIGFDPITTGKSLNILADGATVLLICRLADRLGYRYAGWFGGLLYALTSTPISVSIGGMETALVTCAGLFAILAFVDKRPIEFATSAGVLFLLRVDSLLLTTILALAWLMWQRESGAEPASRIGRNALLFFCALTLPWLVFSTSYFGSPFPASMIAKLSVYERTRQGAFPNLAEFQLQFAGGSVRLLLSLLFVLGATYAWRQFKPLRAPLLWLSVYYGAMLVTRVPAFGWYFLPPLPLYNLCIGLGIAGALVRFAPSARGPIAVAALLVLAVPLTWHLRSITRDVASAQRLEDEVRKPLGLWLAANAEPAETVMLEPIGYIGYHSRLRVLDMIGLVSPQVIPCYRSTDQNPLACIVKSNGPDWLVLRTAERRALEPASRAPFEGGSGALFGEYRWVRGFPDPATGPAFEVYRRTGASRGQQRPVPGSDARGDQP